MISIMMIVVFCTLMALAAFTDLTSMKIPNWLCLTVFVAFWVFVPFAGFSWGEIGTHALVGLTVFVIGLVMFALGWVGGGDAKLLAATSFWWLWMELLSYIVVTALAGGLLAICLLLLRKWPLPSFMYRWTWMQTLLKEEKDIPYGVALAVGGVVTLLNSDILLRVTQTG